MADMRLTDADKATFTSYLTEKGARRACPSCGKDDWSLAPDVVSIPAYNPAGQTPDGVYPAILLFCNNCAFCRFHAAIQSGVMKSDQQEAEEATKGAAHGA